MTYSLNEWIKPGLKFIYTKILPIGAVSKLKNGGEKISGTTGSCKWTPGSSNYFIMKRVVQSDSERGHYR